MTFQINLSAVKMMPFDFEKAIADHIKALKAHQLTIHEPVPTSHPMVEHAIRRVQYPIDDKKPDDFVADFQVIDDSPSLDERKAALGQSIRQEANGLIQAIMPPLKQRLWEMQYQDAIAIDVKKRSSAQKTEIAKYEAKVSKVQAIMRHLAQQESDIHDLTDATIDGWRAAPFPT